MDADVGEQPLSRVEAIETATAWGTVLISLKTDAGESVAYMLTPELASSLMHGLADLLAYLGQRREPDAD
ncbi:hypothetical protein [Solimonas variicoloris]|uniref:hypothetical protein n=1 Tax=Solimonas variicoloris TaxID=254408 RepID=UPI0003808413|nr:hypothetical protein [Solimonas variicoloris]